MDRYPQGVLIVKTMIKWWNRFSHLRFFKWALCCACLFCCRLLYGCISCAWRCVAYRNRVRLVWDTVGSVFQPVWRLHYAVAQSSGSSRCSVPLRWSIVAMLFLYWPRGFLLCRFLQLSDIDAVSFPPCLCFVLWWKCGNALALLSDRLLCCHLVLCPW